MATTTRDSDPGMGDGARGNKHRTDSGPGSRAKRAKYTPLACNECKKRKMKCIPEEGHSSCQRCLNTGTDCIFAPNPPPSKPPNAEDRFEAIDGQIATLQRRMNLLERELRGARSKDVSSSSQPTGNAGAESSNTSRRSNVHRQPGFVGPTRPSFNFDVARSPLRDQGMANEASVFSVAASPAPTDRDLASESAPSADPLWSLGKDEILRLIEVFADEQYPIYPFVNLAELVEFTNAHYGDGNLEIDPSSPAATSPECILKVVIAISKVIECLGRNELSRQLVESVEMEIFGASISSGVLFREMVATALLSQYHFHTDQELLAWRTIGFASRMMLEMGLHRKDSLMANIPEPEQRVWAIRLFWCVYVLDRRWSFGRSLPFALQDADIDPELPEPDQEVEYLQCLVKYGRICSKIWQAFPSFGPPSKGIPDDTVSYLEFQIQKWVASIPPHLRLIQSGQSNAPQNSDRVNQRLRALLYLRGNHARLLLNRHHVLSAANIRADLPGAQRVVDIAKDSIRVLVELNNASDIYMRQQAAFNYFLVSSLAAIFLAVCHYPAMFSTQCRQSFYQAVSLVRGFSLRSSVSRRLWKSVKGLLPEAQKLGLEVDSSGHIETSGQQSVSADSALLLQNRGQGTTGQFEVDGRLPTPQTNASQQYGYNGMGWQTGNSITEPSPAFSGSIPDMGQMTNDLTSFYEAFGQMDDSMLYGTGDASAQFPMMSESGEVSRLFQDLMSW